MGIFDWFKRKKYYYSLSKEERERDKKRRECHGHLFVEVKGGGKKGGEPYPDEIYLECSKCGFGHYKSTLTKEELKENRFPKPIKNWNESKKMEIPTLKLEGKINGIEKKYHKNGKLWIEVNMKNGKRDGVKKQYYENGNIHSECKYKDDERNGDFKEFHENGKIKRSGEIRKGNPIGILKSYYENGKIKTEEDHSDQKNGVVTCKTYHENGNIYEELSYMNGKIHGDFKVYFENGILGVEGKMENGENDGQIITYHQKTTSMDKSLGFGTKQKVEFYKNGVLDGPSMRYDEDGNYIETTMYKNGEIEFTTTEK